MTDIFGKGMGLCKFPKWLEREFNFFFTLKSTEEKI